jgi:hypothetical protein
MHLRFITWILWPSTLADTDAIFPPCSAFVSQFRFFQQGQGNTFRMAMMAAAIMLWSDTSRSDQQISR